MSAPETPIGREHVEAMAEQYRQARGEEPTGLEFRGLIYRYPDDIDALVVMMRRTRGARLS